MTGQAHPNTGRRWGKTAALHEEERKLISSRILEAHLPGEGILTIAVEQPAAVLGAQRSDTVNPLLHLPGTEVSETVYGLSNWATRTLTTDDGPRMLLPLFLPEEAVNATPAGRVLREARSLFVTRTVAAAAAVQLRRVVGSAVAIRQHSPGSSLLRQTADTFQMGLATLDMLAGWDIGDPSPRWQDRMERIRGGQMNQTPAEDRPTQNMAAVWAAELCAEVDQAWMAFSRARATRGPLYRLDAVDRLLVQIYTREWGYR